MMDYWDGENRLLCLATLHSHKCDRRTDGRTQAQTNRVKLCLLLQRAVNTIISLCFCTLHQAMRSIGYYVSLSAPLYVPISSSGGIK